VAVLLKIRVACARNKDDSLIKLKSALTVNTHPDAVDPREDSEFQRKIKDPESATLWSVTIWGWTEKFADKAGKVLEF
jgi:hypothetical protein